MRLRKSMCPLAGSLRGPYCATRRSGIPTTAIFVLVLLGALFSALPLCAQDEREIKRAPVVKIAAPPALGRTDTNWLVAVGINNFNDAAVSKLRGCVADARAIHEFFTTSGFVPEPQAYLLVTDAAQADRRPTRVNILKAIQYVARKAEPDSTILISFAGHGFLDPAGESYLMPEDGDVELLRDTAVPVARVNEMLRESKSKRKIVFMDACRVSPRAGGRGSESGPITDKFLEALKAGEGQVTMASCGKGQASMEMPDGVNGVFTHHLLQGLRGGADADANGIITLTHLQAYVAQSVPNWCRQNLKPDQQPWMWGEMSVPIPLAMKGGDLPPPPVAPTPPRKNGPSDRDLQLCVAAEKAAEDERKSVWRVKSPGRDYQRNGLYRKGEEHMEEAKQAKTDGDLKKALDGFQKAKESYIKAQEDLSRADKFRIEAAR